MKKNRHNVMPVLSLLYLYYSLRHHCIGDLEEARDVRAANEVVLVSVFLCGDCHDVIEIYHTGVEQVIDLFKRPADARAVLAHLERGGCNAARVCRLAGGKKYLVLQEHLGCLCCRGPCCTGASSCCRTGRRS